MIGTNLCFRNNLGCYSTSKAFTILAMYYIFFLKTIHRKKNNHILLRDQKKNVTG